jgi:hypothetical protein
VRPSIIRAAAHNCSIPAAAPTASSCDPNVFPDSFWIALRSVRHSLDPGHIHPGPCRRQG